MKLFKKAKSRFYWFDFTVRGQRYRGSTGETKAVRATKVASIKLAQALDHGDLFPTKAAVLAEFSERFLSWLEEARLDGWVFPPKRSVPGHLRSICNLFRKARREAGLPKELVLYCARHDYGTRILTLTENLAAVMKTMGHRDVKTAMQYQHPELEVVRAALDYRASTDMNETKGATESPCGSFQVPPENHHVGKLLRASGICR